MKSGVKKIVMTALFAALACAATMAIRIPTPGTGGYIHPGDAIVILSGIILGPACGFLAGGVGSALADLLGGYFFYVPITLVIKGLIAFLSAVLYRKVNARGKHRCLGVILGGIADILLVAGGYFLCESFLYGAAGALASVPANLIQGGSGLVLSLVLYPVLTAVPDVRKMLAASLKLRRLSVLQELRKSSFQNRFQFLRRHPEYNIGGFHIDSLSGSRPALHVLSIRDGDHADSGLLPGKSFHMADEPFRFLHRLRGFLHTVLQFFPKPSHRFREFCILRIPLWQSHGCTR